MTLKARDLMDEPDFIDADASLEDVENEFKGSENTLIVKRDGEVIGEIHEGSLLKMMIPEEKVDEEKVIGILGLSFDRRYVPEKAEDLMDRHDVSIKPDTEMGDIAFIMDKENVRSLPVKEDGEIIGVVHEKNLIEAL